MSVRAKGLKAIADMSAKYVSFLGRIPLLKTYLTLQIKGKLFSKYTKVYSILLVKRWLESTSNFVTYLQSDVFSQ